MGRSGINITPMLMGTWQAGKSMWAGIDDAETLKSIRIAFDLGMNVFDTAATYGDGYSEQILGKALSDVRSDAIIATKVFFTQLKYEQVIESCHQSLIN